MIRKASKWYYNEFTMVLECPDVDKAELELARHQGSWADKCRAVVDAQTKPPEPKQQGSAGGFLALGGGRSVRFDPERGFAIAHGKNVHELPPDTYPATVQINARRILALTVPEAKSVEQFVAKHHPRNQECK
jgi:hypothetical protein